MSVLASLTGSSVEDASRLQQVWRSTGLDMADLMDIVAQVNSTLAASPELAEELNVTMGRTPLETFLNVQQAISGIGDSTQRLTVASQIYGEEGVRQMQLVETAVGDVSNAMADVETPLTEDDIRRAQDYDRKMRELNSTMRSLGQTVGRFVIPIVEEAADTLERLADPPPDQPGESWWDFLFHNYVDNAEAATEAAEDTTDAQRDFGTAVQESNDLLADQRQAIMDVLDAQLAVGDSMFAYEDAMARVAEATGETAAAQVAYNEAMGTRDPADDAAAVAGLDRAIRSERDAILEAAGAAVTLAEEQDEANGITFTASRRTQALNEALITQAQNASPEAKAEIARYISTVYGIPLSRATEILANADADQAVRDLNNAANPGGRGRDADINVRVHTAEALAELRMLQSAYQAAARPRVSSSSASVSSVTNVTMHMPRGMRPDDAVRAVDRYSRRNGRHR